MPDYEGFMREMEVIMTLANQIVASGVETDKERAKEIAEAMFRKSVEDYRAAGSPYGDEYAGLMRWLEERDQAI